MCFSWAWSNRLWQQWLWGWSPFSLTCAISHIALTATILCFYHPELPQDARTILQTRTVQTGRGLCNGLYDCFGIVSAFGMTSSRWKDKVIDGSCLRLQINIDGMPYFKSSVVTGLYSGTKTPDSSAIFSEDFVSEFSQLEGGLWGLEIHFDTGFSHMWCTCRIFC